jgi:hypothetical protein
MRKTIPAVTVGLLLIVGSAAAAVDTDAGARVDPPLVGQASSKASLDRC